jgi:hypothetical protein
MKKLYFISILFLIFSYFNTKAGEGGEKSSNVEKIKYKYIINPFFIYESPKLSIKNLINERNNIIYKPNVGGNFGIKVGYRKLSIALAFKLPQSDIYGNTKASKIGIDIQGKNIGFSIFYNNYKGMYLDNYTSFYSQKFILRPDIKYYVVGFQTTIDFSKDFSINAAFAQTERQKSTAGSFMLALGNKFTRIKADSTFIIYDEQAWYVDSKDITAMNTYNIKAAPGYGMSFVFKKYFSITAVVFTGFDFQLNFYNKASNIKVKAGFPFYAQSKLAAGYNGKEWFCNLIYNIDMSYIKFTDSRFGIYNNNIKISIGKRFGL